MNLKYKSMKRHLFLFFVLSSVSLVYAARVDTLVVKSNSMNKEISNVVILPNTYNLKDVKLPVVYLLHGAGGDHTGWIKRVPEIKSLADMYNVIIVCPDGEKTSWYLDSPIDKTMRYETYMYNELVKAVDSNYKTIANKSGRAITGLSMGGHGAFYLAFKHQDVWGAAGSMSGGVDIRPFSNNWGLSKRLGEYAKHKSYWETHTVINMVYKITPKSLKLILDCGTDDFFFEANQRLHKKLMERNIPHDYIERPGKHNWAYWSNSIKYQFLFFNDFFKTKQNLN